jgi:hypothetical protein
MDIFSSLLWVLLMDDADSRRIMFGIGVPVKLAFSEGPEISSMLKSAPRK